MKRKSLNIIYYRGCKGYSIMCKKILFIIFISAFILLSCDNGFPEDCFKSTGKQTWEHRTVKGFYKIQLHDNIDLYIYPDSINKIKVEAGDKLIDKVTTNVTDSILVIKNDNICNWLRDPDKPIIVHVYTNALREIDYQNSTGNITTNSPITGSRFRLSVDEGHGLVNIHAQTHHALLHYRAGTADINFHGDNVDYLGVFLGGLGKFDSRNMQCRHVYINQMSNNNAYTFAKEILTVELHLSGNIYYLGEPKINLKGRHGQGNVIALE